MTREHPSDWDERKRTVYRRDNYTCINCSRKGKPYGGVALHAHHVVPREMGGTSKRSNLMTVCECCQEAIEGRALAPTAQESPDPGVAVVPRLVALGVFVALVVLFETVFELVSGGLPPSPSQWVAGLVVFVPLYFGTVAVVYDRSSRTPPLPGVVQK